MLVEAARCACAPDNCIIMMSMARPIPNLLQVPFLWAFAAYNKLCDMLRGAMDALRALSLGPTSSQTPDGDAKIAVGARIAMTRLVPDERDLRDARARRKQLL